MMQVGNTRDIYAFRTRSALLSPFRLEKLFLFLYFFFRVLIFNFALISVKWSSDYTFAAFLSYVFWSKSDYLI
jgi:hypothetical protein